MNSKDELSHNGLSLTVDGTVKLQLSARSEGRFEAFYNSLKPIHVLHQQLELAAPGKIPSGVTEIPFELTLRAQRPTRRFTKRPTLVCERTVDDCCRDEAFLPQQGSTEGGGVHCGVQ